MEFKKTKATGSTLHSINGAGYKVNPQSLASDVMPAPVKNILQALSQKHGLKIDVTNLDLKKLTPEGVNAFSKVADLVAKNSKALPILYKNLVKLLKAEVAEAQFYAAVTKECLDAKAQIDQATAAAFLAMHGYKAKSSVLESKVSAAVKVIDARSNAYARQYEGKAGDSLQIVDAWFEEGRTLAQHQTDAKKQQIKTLGASKRADAEYVQKMKNGHKDANPSTHE